MIDNEKVEEILLTLEDRLDKNLSVLKDNYAAIRAGRANPHILDKIQVEAYGTMTPLYQLGNISVSDARCLVVSPWDKSLLKAIEKAILASNIGITPANDGTVIRLVFPVLTEERRKELVKQVSARNIRRDTMEILKKMKNNKELSEDENANLEQDVEEAVSKTMGDIDTTVSAKEKELMTV